MTQSSKLIIVEREAGAELGNRDDIWWGVVWRRFVDWAGAPVLAFMFWFIVILMAIFATAEGSEGNHFTTFFTVFGAVGQVFFAAMVWKLSRQQFRLSQAVAIHQTQIDTFPLKSEVFEEYRQVEKDVTLSAMTEQTLFALMRVSARVEAVFDYETVSAVEQLVRAVDVYVSVKEEEDYDEMNDRPDLAVVHREKRLAAGKEVRRLKRAAFIAIRNEVRITPLRVD